MSLETNVNIIPAQSIAIAVFSTVGIMWLLLVLVGDTMLLTGKMPYSMALAGTMLITGLVGLGILYSLLFTNSSSVWSTYFIVGNIVAGLLAFSVLGTIIWMSVKSHRHSYIHSKRRE